MHRCYWRYCSLKIPSWNSIFVWLKKVFFRDSFRGCLALNCNLFFITICVFFLPYSFLKWRLTFFKNSWISTFYCSGPYDSTSVWNFLCHEPWQDVSQSSPAFPLTKEWQIIKYTKTGGDVMGELLCIVRQIMWITIVLLNIRVSSGCSVCQFTVFFDFTL